MVELLLGFYDYPHPDKPGQLIEGYDKFHALRTAKMCAAVAHELGHGAQRIYQYQVACILHDLGRAGLDQNLFGKIWRWARARGIPTRPAAWRAAHPETPYGEETESFWNKYINDLARLDIKTDAWTKEQVEMRLGYARRLRRMLESVVPKLNREGVKWDDWMESVMLYYYYPEKLDDAPDWIHELGEILVACEQLEAGSNRERGNDYYNRSNESFAAAFSYLDRLKQTGQLGEQVLTTVRKLTAQGLFDELLGQARNGKITAADIRYLRSLN